MYDLAQLDFKFDREYEILVYKYALTICIPEVLLWRVPGGLGIYVWLGPRWVYDCSHNVISRRSKSCLWIFTLRVELEIYYIIFFSVELLMFSLLNIIILKNGWNCRQICRLFCFYLENVNEQNLLKQGCF